MQACHRKAHKTSTYFYLKDLTWSVNDLGLLVAAQQFRVVILGEKVGEDSI